MERTLDILGDAPIESEASVPTQRLGELFDRHHMRLFRLARRLTRDPEEARDLVQDTFLRMARRPGSIPGSEAGAEAWLVRTLVNLCRDRHRKVQVRNRHRDDPALRPAPTTFEARAVARATVESALARLPARRRAVVVLHELEELDSAEVADLLGLSQVTVRWHLHAARRDLRRWLTGRK